MGAYTLTVASMGVKFGTEKGTFGPLLLAKFYQHQCNVSPLRGEKPQNRPLSKLITGRLALSAMLPVIKKQKLECGPMPNLMVALPNIGGALC